MNQVALIGRLTAAPTLQMTPSGVEYTAFCIAVDRDYKPKDGERQADFVNCKAWRKSAELICKYFQKGQRIGITGAYRVDAYTDKDGVKRRYYYVDVNSVSFCEKKREDFGALGEPPTNAGDELSLPDFVDDPEVPF